ncbi:MAG: hypothetical protein KIS96_11445 [Bauldia sp.]|nr:hypothetical protein [Bauldia sp.]
MSEFSSNFDGPLSPAGSLADARAVADRTIRLTARTAGTKEAAVYSLSRRYGFGSWLKRLARGDSKIRIDLHLYRRLCRALEEAIKEEERRLAHDRRVLAAIEANHAASHADGALAVAEVAPARRPVLHLVAEPAR